MPGYVLVVRWAVRNKTDALYPALMESIVWGERQSIKMQLKIEILLLKEKRLGFCEEEPTGDVCIVLMEDSGVFSFSCVESAMSPQDGHGMVFARFGFVPRLLHFLAL